MAGVDLYIVALVALTPFPQPSQKGPELRLITLADIRRPRLQLGGSLQAVELHQALERELQFVGVQRVEQDDFMTAKAKVLLAGLEAGQKIPVHPDALAMYHFLEGNGWMIVDGERIAVQAGATIITPEGASRGMEAETRLAFLATRIAGAESE